MTKSNAFGGKDKNSLAIENMVRNSETSIMAELFGQPVNNIDVVTIEFGKELSKGELEILFTQSGKDKYNASKCREIQQGFSFVLDADDQRYTFKFEDIIRLLSSLSTKKVCIGEAVLELCNYRATGEKLYDFFLNASNTQFLGYFDKGTFIDISYERPAPKISDSLSELRRMDWDSFEKEYERRSLEAQMAMFGRPISILELVKVEFGKVLSKDTLLETFCSYTEDIKKIRRIGKRIQDFRFHLLVDGKFKICDARNLMDICIKMGNKKLVVNKSEMRVRAIMLEGDYVGIYIDVPVLYILDKEVFADFESGHEIVFREL